MNARNIASVALLAMALVAVWIGLADYQENAGSAPAMAEKTVNGRLTEKTPLKELLGALKNPDYGILAAVLLSWRDKQVVLPWLLRALKDDNAQMRRHAAMSLGLLRDKSAVPALIEAMKDNEPDVRFRVIEALGHLGDASAIPAVAEALTDKENRLRQKAVEALDKLAYLTNGKPPVARKVEDLGPEQELEEVGPDTSIGELLAALKKPYLSQEAAELLGKKDSKDVLPQLLSALKDDDPLMRRHAAMALGKLGDKSATPALIEALKDKENEVRISVVRAIGDLRDKTALQAVLEALKDPDYQLRQAAVETFGILVYKSGGKEPAGEAEAGSQDEVVEGVAIEADQAEARGLLREQASAAKFIEPVDDGKSDVRTEAPNYQGDIGAQSAISALEKSLIDPNYKVRPNAAETLDEPEGKSAVPAHTEDLKDGNDVVRQTARDALHKLQ